MSDDVSSFILIHVENRTLFLSPFQRLALKSWYACILYGPAPRRRGPGVYSVLEFRVSLEQYNSGEYMCGRCGAWQQHPWKILVRGGGGHRPRTLYDGDRVVGEAYRSIATHTVCPRTFLSLTND